MNAISPAEIIVYLLAGMALGTVYFAVLLHTVRLYTSGASSAGILLLYALRFTAAVLGFWLIARQGAGPLLVALAGFLVARFAVRRWVEAH